MLANNPSVLTGGGVATNVVNGTFQLIGPTGSIALTAQGTNQNITLTPSGTGAVTIASNLTVSGTGASPFTGYIKFASTNIGSGSETWIGSTGSLGGIAFNVPTGGLFTFAVNNVGMANWNSSGNLLFGTTTDSANGKIQLATHTTSAGGIGFGTTVSLFTSATNALKVLMSAPGSFILGDGTRNISLVTSGGNDCTLTTDATNGLILTASGGASSVVLKSANTTALTLDSSQNATFAGIVIHKSYTVATLPAAAAGNTYGTTFVSDATQLAGVGIGTAPTGGGSVKRAVYSTGGGWLLL